MATRAAGLLCCALLPACSAALFGVINTGHVRPGVEYRASVVYDAEHGLALDVHRPLDADGSAALVVFFYGGSWQRGSAAQYAFVGAALAERGIVAVLPNYRMYPTAGFPAFMEDAARAVAWAQAHAGELGADRRRIFLMGHSAGAHIAGLLATDARYLGAVRIAPREIAGVIGLAGPYDVHPAGYPDLEQVFGEPATWPRASALNFIGGDEPPFLLLHGSNDRTVWPANSESLAHALDAVGIEAVLHLYQGVGHSRILMALRFPRLAPVLDDTMAFIAAHPRGQAARPGPDPHGSPIGAVRQRAAREFDSSGLSQAQVR
jgi:acetyl esterase/lipase